MTRLSSSFIILLLFGFTWINLCSESESGSRGNVDDPSVAFGGLIDARNGKNRTKRTIQHNAGLQQNNPTSIEGLLSSCQLTNLLLYQLLNQRQNGPVAPLGSNILQPFPAAANNILFGLPQPVINPYAPILQTYTTTSIYLTEMTTTNIHTITLLFGNKESMTTVTQTKLYNATTSTILTLTSSIQPTQATPTSIEIQPTATLPPVLPTTYYDVEPNEIMFKKLAQEDPIITQVQRVPVPTPAPVLKQKPIRQKQRRKYARQKNINADNYRGFDDSGLQNTSPSFKFGQVQNFTPLKKQRFISDSPTEDDYYYQKHNPQPNYYTRRSKRRGDSVADPIAAAETSHEFYDNPEPYLEREYLLEPSSDASFTDNVAIEACPGQTVTVTITKTLTKYVNPSVSASVSTRFKGEDDPNDEYERFEISKFSAENITRKLPILTGISVSEEIPQQQQQRLSTRTKGDKKASVSNAEKQRSSNRLRSGRSSSREFINSPSATSPMLRDSDVIRSINDNRRNSRFRNSQSRY